MPRSAEGGPLRLAAAGGPRIAIFASPREGLARALARRFAALGAGARIVRLDDCAFDTGSPSGVRIPGFGRTLPQGCLVRMVAGGTFEAVTRRLGVLHALRELGVPVWNDARAIEACVDKSQTTFLLQRAGLPVPPTWTVETRTQAEAVVRRETRRGPLVLKPLFGSQGRGLRLIHSLADLPGADEVDGVWHLQRFLGVETAQGYRDYRVFVVAGSAVAGMVRHGDGWITNVRQGGRPEPLGSDHDLERLAVAAARAVGAGFCGVDLLRDRRGEPFILEVNSMPAWSGLQKVARCDIAGEIAAAFLAHVTAAARRSA
jgi:tetrahydromethanopterin:alpha-L-glutamate ligase